MNRIEKFESFWSHPMHSKDMKRLSEADLQALRDFLEEYKLESDDDFMLAANRFQLDRPKSKNYSIMWSLLIQTVDTVGNIRRRRAQEQKIVKLSLHPYFERHTGHCQITYTAKNDAGQTVVYCLQDNGKNFGGVRLMRCSQDGEPSHEVTFDKKYKPVFEKPTGDSELEQLVREWIDKNQEKICL